MADFKLPRIDQHFLEIGKNGSGKSQAGLFYLERRLDYPIPWIIIDTKRDGLIADIEPIEIGLTDKLPTKRGLYVVRPIPKVHDEAVENLLWRIWQQENTGIFIDEAYNLPDNSDAVTALLTQGRSKHTPMHILAQRPVWIDRFMLSEAGHFNVFFLNDRRDKSTVQEFIPYPLDAAFGSDPQYRLPKYWSLWHDVEEGATHILRPVPDRDTIISAFRARVPRKRFL